MDTNHHEPPPVRGIDWGSEYKKFVQKLNELSGVVSYPESIEGHKIKGYVPKDLQAYQAGTNTGRVCFSFDIENNIAYFGITDFPDTCDAIFNKIVEHVESTGIHRVHCFQ